MPRSLLVPLLLLVLSLAFLGGLWLSQASTAARGGLPWNHAPPQVQAVMWPEPRELGAFTLSDGDGQAFGRDQLHGRWSLFFFGYMGCPDVCPSSLHAMRLMGEMLARHAGDAHDVQFIFVSVDPARDTPEAVRDYVAWFDAGIIGLTGTEAELAELTRRMAVRYEEHVDDSGFRAIDHTSSLMVVDPDGRLVGALPPPLQPERMVQQFHLLRDHLEPTHPARRALARLF